MNPYKKKIMTILIVVGIFLAYVHQMAPAPLLSFIREEYNIQSEAMLNLSVSIMNPAIIVASIWGAAWDRRFGTARLFIYAMLFTTVGMLLNFVAVNYIIFLLGRIVFGFGFGLAIPFFGAAVKKWYSGREQENMNTINGLFPYLGTVVSMGLLAAMYKASNSFGVTLGLWGIPLVFVMLLWSLTMFTGEGAETLAGDTEEEEKGLYLGLWKRKDVRLLCLTFFCDFFCYQYVVTVLPTFFMEAANLSENVAGLVAAIAFPAVGIFGASIGGAVMSSTGLRKPGMLWGQLIQVVGLVCLALFSKGGIVIPIICTAVYAIGNSMWLPAMYMVGTEQEDMTPVRVGAVFALISSCGFLAGALSPVIGGWLTTALAAVSKDASAIAQHVFGLKGSLFLFAFANVLNFFFISRLRETGTPRKQKN